VPEHGNRSTYYSTILQCCRCCLDGRLDSHPEMTCQRHAATSPGERAFIDYWRKSKSTSTVTHPVLYLRSGSWLRFPVCFWRGICHRLHRPRPPTTTTGRRRRFALSPRLAHTVWHLLPAHATRDYDVHGAWVWLLFHRRRLPRFSARQSSACRPQDCRVQLHRNSTYDDACVALSSTGWDAPCSCSHTNR
jgi:hypothetical protein